MQQPDIPEKLIQKFKCVTCDNPTLKRSNGDLLRCIKCEADYPLRSGRFPDFLTNVQREQLNSEIEFWEHHFGDTVYESENEASYRLWADLIDPTSTDEVIELGCGSGAQLRRLDVGLRVGLEPVIGLLTATSDFYGVVGTVEEIPFNDESFDLVYFNYSLHHVNDKERGMSEAARITRSGGRVVAIEPNADHPQRRLINRKNSPLGRCRLLSGFVDPVETFFTANEVTQMAERYGLIKEKLVYRESMYDKPTMRYRFQQLYSRLGRFVLPHRYVYPSFYISFRKP